MPATYLRITGQRNINRFRTRPTSDRDFLVEYRYDVLANTVQPYLKPVKLDRRTFSNVCQYLGVLTRDRHRLLNSRQRFRRTVLGKVRSRRRRRVPRLDRSARVIRNRRLCRRPLRLGQRLRRRIKLARSRPGENAGFARVRIFPTVLDANVSFLESSVDTQLDHERFCFEFPLPGDLFRAFGEYMVQALLESATLYALPLLVVGVREKDSVLARDDRRSLR